MNDPIPSQEEKWCASQRAEVVDYLERQRLTHGGLGDWPAWHLWPYVAVWAVESVSRPGWVGWWVVSGDLPTDYTSCGPARHPREGVRDIALRWQQAASLWKDGKQSDGFRIGSSTNEAPLAPLLAERADLLLSFADDDSLWPE